MLAPDLDNAYLQLLNTEGKLCVKCKQILADTGMIRSGGGFTIPSDFCINKNCERYGLDTVICATE